MESRWHSEGGVVYAQQQGGWQPYPRCAIDGGTMMFAFGDGCRAADAG